MTVGATSGASPIGVAVTVGIAERVFAVKFISEVGTTEGSNDGKSGVEDTGDPSPKPQAVIVPRIRAATTRRRYLNSRTVSTTHYNYSIVYGEKQPPKSSDGKRFRNGPRRCEVA